MRLILLSFLDSALLFTSSAWASDVAFDFATATMHGTYGQKQSFTSTDGTQTITAYGYLSASSPTRLYGKYTPGTPDETGLGLAVTPDHEIQGSGSNFIQLDVSGLLKGFKSGSMTIGSLQPGETYQLWGSNMLGKLGTKLSTSATSSDALSTFALTDWGKYAFYGITAPSGNNLIDNALMFTPSAVPEPASLTLLGIGLLSMAVVVRKNRKARNQGSFDVS